MIAIEGATYMKKPTGAVALPCLLTAAVLFFTACSPSVILTVGNGTSGTGLFSADMSPTAENLVRRFSGNDTASGTASTGTKESQFFDRDKITLSLAHAGIKADSIDFPSRAGIAIGVSFLRLDGLLARAVTLVRDENRIEIRLTRESVNAAVATMPADTRDYLDLLMAPVFTGETMNPAEYESIIAAAYGKTLAAELKKSAFTLTVRCPAPVKNTAAGENATVAATDSSAVFTIPLATLLAMDKPITALAEW